MKRLPPPWLRDIPPHPTGSEGWNVQKWDEDHGKFLCCGPRGNRSKAEGFMLALHEAFPFSELRLVDEQGVTWEVMGCTPPVGSTVVELYTFRDGVYVEAPRSVILAHPVVREVSERE